MAVLANPRAEKDAFKLLLSMQLRPADSPNLEIMELMRKDHENTQKTQKDEPGSLKYGETKTVPVTITTTTTTVEGIGPVSEVRYGIITFEATKTGVAMEKRSVWGDNLSGFMTFNE